MCRFSKVKSFWMGLMNTLCCTPDFIYHFTHQIQLTSISTLLVRVRYVHAWPPNISIVKTDFVRTHPSKDVCTISKEKIVKLKIVHLKDFKRIFNDTSTGCTCILTIPCNTPSLTQTGLFQDTFAIHLQHKKMKTKSGGCSQEKQVGEKQSTT